jgi:hypothetical protein
MEEQCTSCDSVEIFGMRGDGNCSVCHGTGKEQGLGGLGADALGFDRQDCYACGGSRKCQTCGGRGVVTR